jgi:uncharacterized protein YqjF (DUF2071 family)
MLQDWEALTFLHWRYDAGALERMLPPGVEIETCDGSAWVGLVPFRIANLRHPSLPALPWISHFPETNVRTYVRGPGGKPGVWFFTLEAARLAAVAGARLTFGLPYRWAAMSFEKRGSEVTYISSRRAAHTHIRIATGDPVPAGSLEHFLTARFCLYATRFGKLLRGDIDHEPWPLRSARVLHLDENLIAACGLQVSGPPLVHYAEVVHTRVAIPVISDRGPAHAR